MRALPRRSGIPAGAASIERLLLLLPLVFGGCAGKDELLPQDGPTMREVYDGHFRRGGQPSAGAGEFGRWLARPGLEGYTREAATEIERQFPRLPNPDLVMYVFPHLSDNGYPVPGYSTVIPMYETVEYALPGEKEGW